MHSENKINENYKPRPFLPVHNCNENYSYEVDSIDGEPWDEEDGEKEEKEEKEENNTSNTWVGKRALNSEHFSDDDKRNVSPRNGLDFNKEDNQDEGDIENDFEYEHDKDEDEEIQEIFETGSYDEETSAVSMSMLEEEIGLNEATLEALNLKISALEVEIGLRRQKLSRHKSNIEWLGIKQIQLRNSRDENASLLKVITATLNKCIRRLRDKLDEKNIGLKSEQSRSDLAIEHAPPFVDDNIKADCHSSHDNEQGRQISKGSKLGQSQESAGDMMYLPSSCAKHLEQNEEIGRSKIDMNITPTSNNDCLDQEKEGGPNLTILKFEANSNSISEYSTFSDNDQMSLLFSPVDIEPLHTQSIFLERMWSQNCGTSVHSYHQQQQQRVLLNFYHQSELLEDAVFPLHPPIASFSLLTSIIEVSQREIFANMSASKKTGMKGNIDYFNDDHGPWTIWHEIRGTCLDVLSHVRHDPFIMGEQRGVTTTKSSDLVDISMEAQRNGKEEIKGSVPFTTLSDSIIENKLLARTKKESNSIEQLPTSRSRYRIDSNVIICPYQLAGTCADNSCPYQHLVVSESNIQEISFMNENVESNNSALNNPRNRENTTKVKGHIKDGYTVRLPELKLPPPPLSAMHHQWKYFESETIDCVIETKDPSSFPTTESYTSKRGNNLEREKKRSKADNKRKHDLLSSAVGRVENETFHPNNDSNDDPYNISNVTHGNYFSCDINHCPENGSNKKLALSEPYRYGNSVLGDSACVVFSRKEASKNDEYSLLSSSLDMSMRSKVSEKTSKPMFKGNGMEEIITSYQSASDLMKEEDFIRLPELTNSDGDNLFEKSTKDIKIELDCDLSREEDGKSALDKEIYTFNGSVWYNTGVLRSNAVYEGSESYSPNLLDAISCFGFFATKGVPDKRSEGSKCKVRLQYIPDKCDVNLEDHNKCCPFMNPFQIKQAVKILEFAAALTDTMRICVNAGRFDICFPLLERALEFMKQNRPQEDEDDNFVQHLVIISKVVADVNKIVDGALCGRSATSCYGIFHAQLSLAVIANMLGAYHQMILIENKRMTSSKAKPRTQFTKPFEKRVIDFFENYNVFVEKMLGERHLKEGMVQNHEDNILDFGSLLSKKSNEHFSGDLSCPEKRMQKLYQCVVNGFCIAKSIAKQTIEAEINDAGPQILLQDVLEPLAKKIQSFTALSRDEGYSSEALLSSDDAKSSDICGNFTRLSNFALFGNPILTCVSGILRLIEKRDGIDINANRCRFDTSSNGIVLSINRILMTVLQQVNNSGVPSENFGETLLSAPFYSLIVSILISLGSFSRAQLLLENELFYPPTDFQMKTNDNKWCIFSDLLWSQLFQLRICFPFGKDLSIKGTLKQDKETDSPINSDGYVSNSVSQFDVILAKRALDYGIHVSKIFLPGDSSMVLSTLFFMNMPTLDGSEKDRNVDYESFISKKQIKNLSQIRQGCMSFMSMHDYEKIPLHIEERFFSDWNDGHPPLKPENALKLECGKQSFRLSIRHLSKKILASKSISRLNGDSCIPTCPRSILLFGNSLKTLILIGCGLHSLPITLGDCLPGLKVIDVSFNKLKSLPESMSVLSKLSTLNISSNLITFIPHFIGKLKALCALDISNNYIDAIPYDLCNCEKLSRIDLRQNNIKHVPSALPLRLTKLSALLLDGNPVVEDGRR